MSQDAQKCTLAFDGRKMALARHVLTTEVIFVTYFAIVRHSMKHGHYCPRAYYSLKDGTSVTVNAIDMATICQEVREMARGKTISKYSVTNYALPVWEEQGGFTLLLKSDVPAETMPSRVKRKASDSLVGSTSTTQRVKAKPAFDSISDDRFNELEEKFYDLSQDMSSMELETLLRAAVERYPESMVPEITMLMGCREWAIKHGEDDPFDCPAYVTWAKEQVAEEEEVNADSQPEPDEAEVMETGQDQDDMSMVGITEHGGNGLGRNSLVSHGEDGNEDELLTGNTINHDEDVDGSASDQAREMDQEEQHLVIEDFQNLCQDITDIFKPALRSSWARVSEFVADLRK